MPALTAYAEERIILWRRLLHESRTTSLAEYFRPTANELRYHLGTSLADLRIPWRLGADFNAVATAAALDAFVMACVRHESALAPGEADQVCAAARNDGSGLRALAWSPPSSITSPNLLRTFADAVVGHPGIDAGFVASVLGTNTPGRTLLRALHGVFARAAEESRTSAEKEPTVWIVALGLRTLADRLQTLVRTAPVSESSGRWLRGILAVVFAETAHLALRETGIAREAGLVPSEEPAPTERRSAVLTLASLGIAPFLGARGSLLQTNVSVYGLPFDFAPPGLEEAMRRLHQKEEPAQTVRHMAAALMREPDALKRLERAAAFASMRDNLRALARLVDSGRSRAISLGDTTPSGLLFARDGLERAFSSESRRRALEESVREASRRATSDEARNRLDALAHAAREFNDEAPAAWLGTNETRLAIARSLVAFAADELMERYARAAQAVLLERTGDETEGGGEAEYDSGRLYVISADDRPLLKPRSGASQVGHLFCDMKDFTRRTALLKESVIADFLQREFYSPILQAASGHDPGARLPSPTQNVVLNNLLGDAVSFSGDIVALVRLSHDIQRILRSYARRLEQEASSEVVTSRVRALEAEHRAKRQALAQSIRDLRMQAEHQAPAIRAAMHKKVRDLLNEQSRRDALFEVQRSRAVGERLEAGTFISYGAAPEVAQFEDAIFGFIKVAIAEKINESARGTARSGAVRASVDAHEKRAREATGRALVSPFEVFVRSPPALNIAPATLHAAAELQAKGDVEGAKRIVADAALVSLGQPGPGEIYNAGAALSEDALEAWVAATQGDFRTIRTEIALAALHPALTERFFFPNDPLKLVASAKRGQASLAELFVYQGRVVFKGFEASNGLGVWEAIDPESEFFKLLAKHHASAWFKP